MFRESARDAGQQRSEVTSPLTAPLPQRADEAGPVPRTRGTVEKARRRRLRDGRLTAGDSCLLVGIMTMAALSAWGQYLVAALVQIACALVVLVVGLAVYEQ